MTSDAKHEVVKSGLLQSLGQQSDTALSDLALLRHAVVSHYRSVTWGQRPQLAAAAGGSVVSPLLLRQYTLSWLSLPLTDAIENTFLVGNKLRIGRFLMDMGQEDADQADSCHAALVVLVAGLQPEHYCQTWLGATSGRELPEQERTQIDIPYAIPWREWVFEFEQIANQDLDVRLQEPMRLLFQSRYTRQSWGGQLHLLRDFTPPVRG